jgi:hypothetical protein
LVSLCRGKVLAFDDVMVMELAREWTVYWE